MDKSQLPRLQDLESAHPRTLACLGATTFLLSGLCLGTVNWIAPAPLDLSQNWALTCVIFLFCWWLVYFNGHRLRIWTLRRFLVDKSRFRTLQERRAKKIPVGGLSADSQDNSVSVSEGIRCKPFASPITPPITPIADSEEWDDMKDKTQSTMNTLSILIAVITLFLTLVLQHPKAGPSQQTEVYDIILYNGVVTVAIATIICMVFAIDILDTVANLFLEDKYEDGDSSLAYSSYYYRKIGPRPPSGGISYAYYGYALFSIFIVMSVAFFQPLFAGVGISAYCYFGYPFWFGYKGKEYSSAGEGDPASNRSKQARVEFDEAVMPIPRRMALFFLAVTLGIEWLRLW